MYCGHCGAAVGERDVFCNACGARFVDDPAAAAGNPDPWAATAAGATVASAPPPPPPTTVSPWGTATEPTTAMPRADPDAPSTPPPAQFVPLAPGPRRGGWRPFAIGAAFALIIVAGVAAYFALRDDDPGAAPDPSGAPVLVATTTTVPTTTTNAPTTLPPTTVAPTEAPTTIPPTEAPTTPSPATAGDGPIPTVAPIMVAPTTPSPTATPETTPATQGTTLPTAPPATAAPTTVATSGNVPASMSQTVSAVRSSATRPNSVDSCGKPTSYGPLNVLDGSFDSAWMTVGNGGGQYVEMTLRKGAEISTVGLVPGYAKQDPCTGQDRFLDMRRIAEVAWTFDGGDEIVQQLDVDSPTMQTIELPAPISPSKVRMTIRATTTPGTSGFDYAPVSEVTLA
ncbi:MAG: hypothetical protein QM733_10875 [Ilumatobacteraceae bacterium]